MTVTMLDAPNSVLASRVEPLNFTATLPITAISIGYGASRVEERVYRDGAFLYPYLQSSKNGNAWEIIRAGGWSRPFEIFIDEDASGGLGGNLSPVPGFEAWYVLDPIRRLFDQTGNGHTLTGSSTEVAGRNPGMVALTSVGLSEASPSAVWRTAGAITIVAFVNIAGSAGDRWFASCEAFGGFNTWWKFGLSSSGRSFYGVNNGVGSSNTEWGPALPTSDWHTFGFSRGADGVSLKAYLDGELVGTATSPMFPVGGGSAGLTIGKDLFASVQSYNQQCTALALSELSAGQMAELSARIQGAA
jgi:hypothetical protein